ncbi:DNA ligase 1 [Apiospora marii]|uniref:DNA ligase n=1 Tax=Apiospora marii TaxID=335849 RepID=A0ABR1S488_9PEZI
MAPKQATLGKFFGKPNGAKSAPQQSKLSFATKATAKKPKEEEETEDEPTEASASSKVKDESDHDADVASPASDTKKRSRASPAPKPSKAKSTRAAAKVKTEEMDVDEDEEEAPVSKRPRRNRNKVEEDEDEDEVMADPEPVKPKKSLAKKKEVVKKEESPEEESPKKAAPKKAAPKKEASKKAAVTSSAASKKKQKEPEPKEEEDESVKEESTASEAASDMDVDEEDEKPKAAAKAREKVQTKLISKAKDPYPDWKEGTPVPYAALCTTFSLVEMTSKRLVITEHCALFLRQVLRLTPDDFLPTVNLMINKLAPDYAGIELGIGESLIMKAIGETTGRSLQVIKQDQKEIGDLGLVAVKSRSTQPTMFKPKALTIRGVHKGLMEIATVSGHGAQGRKVDNIKKLLSAADAHSTGKIDVNTDKGGPSEAKFIVRFLEGKLRLGLAEKTVLVSIAQAVCIHEAEQKGQVPSTADMEKAEQLLKTVYSELPSWDVIVPAMLKNGIMKLRESCKLRPGVPLKPMLANPTKAITEVLDRFENQTFTCEFKYDGERAQIHYVAKEHQDEYIDGVPGATQEAAKGIASVFSRNSEDLSKKYPDILAKLHTWVKEGTKSFVMDCESVAWDVAEKKVLPFQQLMTRKKKDVKIEDVKVKVCVFAFDLLFLNGEALVEKSLRERRELMYESFKPVEGEFAFATSMDGQEIEQIQTFLEESIKASCEGLMVKMLDGTESGYEPSKRSRNWLKIKKDYLAGIGDSLDLVVLGAYYGKGKRTSVYGAFLLACYNSANDTYETICNIGTGFSEQVLEELHKTLSEIVIDRPKPFYSHSSGGQHQPDVWFEPRYVWEVKTADLTLSPRYKAAISEGADPAGEKGISLRFPRFIKVRDDKKPDEATGSRQVVEMYRKQESVTKNKGPSVDDDFEY